MKANEKVNGLLNFADLKLVRYKILYSFMFAIMLLLALVAILPVIWVFLSGFKTPAEMYSLTPTLLPEKIDFGMIAKAWEKVRFGQAYLNTAYIIIGCLAFDISCNGMLGFVLSRIRPTGSKIIDTLVFWSMLLPGISMVPLYITFTDIPILHINMTGSFLPIWIMSGCNAFNVLMFRNFFNGIPMSYIEAARLDGASDVGIFTKIIIPLSKPIIAVVTIFSVTGSWGSFMWPYLLLGSSQYEPVAVKLYQLTGNPSIQDNELMIIMMLTIIPPAIMYAFFSKQIMGGLNMSGIKG